MKPHVRIFYQFITELKKKEHALFVFCVIVVAGLPMILFTSCSNPLGGTGSIQPGFLGGVLNLTDSSNAAIGFGGGTFVGTTWFPTTAGATDSYGNSNYVMLSTTTNNGALDSTWTPKWSNLVGYWTLDGTVGAIASGAAVSANVGTSGVISGTGLSYAAGQLGQGIQFDGSHKVNINSAANMPTDALTVSAWINISSLASWQAILSTEAFRLEVTMSGTVDFYESGTGGDASRCGSVTTNAWNYIVVSRAAGGSTTIYVNGVPCSTSALGAYNAISGVSIGVNDRSGIGSGDAMLGIVDDVAIWNAALSAAQIQNIYSRQSVKYAGTFTSRVMDGLTSNVSWASLSWASTLPFMKGLPDYSSGSVQNETTANYPSLVGDTPAAGDNNLMNGIIGLWHLDETTGTMAYDRSGNGNNGTANAVVFGAAGKIGTGAGFNGSTSYISVPNNSALDPASMTLAAWIKYVNGTYLEGIVGKYSTPTADWTFRINSSRLLNFTQTGAGGTDMYGTTALADNTWYHVVATYNATTHLRAVYVNGVLDGSSTNANAVPSTTNAVLIGCDYTSTSGRSLNGTIDEVIMWNKALNASEVMQLYRRGANRIKYQVQTCATAAACASSPNWLGPDGTNQTYFSELYNLNSAHQSDGQDLTTNDIVQALLPSMTFSNFGSLSLPLNEYFQYRAIMESDDTNTNNCTYGGVSSWCSPELKSVSASKR